MQKPLVSVIIPAYNAANFVRETLLSVLNQSYNPIEIIFINDGSTDNTLNVLNNFKDKIILKSQDNKGQCAALNHGLRISKGELIKFFDADDIMNPEHIEEQVSKIGDRRDAVVSCSWGRFFNDDPNSAVFRAETVWQDMKPMPWLINALSQKNDMMGGPLWLIPRDIINTAGYWDERLSLNNDFDFMIRVLLNSNDVLFAENAKLYYRTHGNNNLAGSQSRKAMESALLTTDLGCDTILSFENSTITRQICADRYKYWMFHFYPNYMDLFKQAKRKCHELGGSKRKIEAGPKYEIFIKLFGWKFAKLLWMFFHQFRTNAIR